LETRHLEFAIALADATLVRFNDAEQGGFWQSAAESTDLILRVKDDNDGAEPAGNSVATLALLKLAAITGRTEFRAAAEQVLNAAAGKMEQAPHALPYLLQALDFSLEEPKCIALTGELGADGFRSLLLATHSIYLPSKTVLGNQGPVDSFARSLSSRGVAAYVCTGQTCKPPTSDPTELRRLLQG